MLDWSVGWVGLDIVTYDRIVRRNVNGMHGIFQVCGGSEEDMVTSHDRILPQSVY